MPIARQVLLRDTTPRSGTGRLAALALWGWLLTPCARANAQAGAYVPTTTDLLLQGRPAEGVLVLQSGYRNSPFVDADALVFVGATGTTGSQLTGDVLTVSVSLREPHGLGQARFGRFVLSTGAVRPVQMDGIDLLARPLHGSTLEVFAGLPVVPEFGPRAFDWLTGGRLGQRLFDEHISVGVSYLQRRDAGEISAHEIGADMSLQPARWLSIVALGSWALVTHGLAEARVAALATSGRTDLQVFASRLVASRLLPATSLFSVIGAAPSSVAGGDLTFRAFPRLQMGGTLALEALDNDVGYRAVLRSSLTLPQGNGAHVGIEAIRRRLRDEGYSGAALRVSLPLTAALRANATAELVAADHSGPAGSVWPWLRAGASWAVSAHWLLAAALGLKSTPEYQRDLYAMLRVGYQEQLQP